MNNLTIILIFVLLILLLTQVKFEFKLSPEPAKKNAPSTKPDLADLSNAEYRILKMLSEGKANKEIANELSISLLTVKKHVANIFKKLGISKRTEARMFKDELV